MIRHRALRRTGALALLVLGAALLWLAPSSPLGVVAFVVGVALELVGLAIERRSPPR